MTTDTNDDDAEIVENFTRDDVHAKLKEMQKAVRARSPPPASPRTPRPPWTMSTSVHDVVMTPEPEAPGSLWPSRPLSGFASGEATPTPAAPTMHGPVRC